MLTCPSASHLNVVFRKPLKADQGSKTKANGKPKVKKEATLNIKKSGAPAGGPSPQALSALFALLERTQSKGDIQDLILEKGIVSYVGTVAVSEATLDIVVQMVVGLTRGNVRDGLGIEDSEGNPQTEGIVSLLPSLVKEEDIARFAENDRALEKKCLDDLSYWWPKLLAGVGRSNLKYIKTINKKCITKAIGKQNKTALAPKGKANIFISTNAAFIVFNQTVFGEFLRSSAANGEDPGAKRARMMAIEFAALCVEAHLPDNVNKFPELWAAAEEDGFIKTALRNNLEVLSVSTDDGEDPDGEDPDDCFFDDARFAVVRSGQSQDESTPDPDVELVAGANTVDIDFGSGNIVNCRVPAEVMASLNFPLDSSAPKLTVSISLPASTETTSGGGTGISGSASPGAALARRTGDTSSTMSSVTTPGAGNGSAGITLDGGSGDVTSAAGDAGGPGENR